MAQNSSFNKYHIISSLQPFKINIFKTYGKPILPLHAFIF